jgi:hypothetical protein
VAFPEHELIGRLAEQSAALRAGIASMGSTQQLAAFGRASTVSQWAAMATRDVRELDATIRLGEHIIHKATGVEGFLHSDKTMLFEAMSFTAWCFLDRFDYRLDLHDLDEADRYAGQVLTIGGEGLTDATWIRGQTVRARVGDRRYEIDHVPTHLEDAANRLDSALQRDLDPTSMAALARVFRHRSAIEKREDARLDLSRAVELLETLVDKGGGPPEIPVTPLLLAQWLAELGLVYLAAFRQSDQEQYRELAWDRVQAAVDSWPASAEATLAMATVANERTAYQRVWQVADKDAWVHLEASCALARLAAGPGPTDPAVVSGGAKSALDLLHVVIDRQISESNRAAWLPLVAEVTALGTSGVAATDGPLVAAAYVERGRTRLLEARFPDEEGELDALSTTGRAELVDSLRQALRSLRDPLASVHTRIRAQEELNVLVDEVRSLRGMEGFRASPTADQLGGVASHPLIYLVPGEPAGVALVIQPGVQGSQSIPLPQCRNQDIPGVVQRYHQAEHGNDVPAGARVRAIDAISTWAGEAIAEPLGDVLASSPIVHLVLTSWLSGIPVHAARTQRGGRWRYLVEDVDVRYTPSARALAAALGRQPPAREPRMLVIPQPVSAGVALPGAESEVNDVSAKFTDVTVMDRDLIDRDAIREKIGGAGWLHAACHATADPVEPFLSGLLLGGGERFSLRDLFASNRNHLLLAVLSACQTNVADVTLPNESMSLAAGLALGGCRAVIASAWQVPDKTTAALMSVFYRGWRIDGDDVPTALRRAQIAFATGSADVDGWRPEWAEPYGWAGFSYLGP